MCVVIVWSVVCDTETPQAPRTPHHRTPPPTPMSTDCIDKQCPAYTHSNVPSARVDPIHDLFAGPYALAYVLYTTLPGSYATPADLVEAGEVNSMLGKITNTWLPLTFVHGSHEEEVCFVWGGVFCMGVG